MSEPYWKKRVMILIEGSALNDHRILVNGAFRICTTTNGVVISRGEDRVLLKSMEIFDAVVKRHDELWRYQMSAHDDANAEAIERMLA